MSEIRVRLLGEFEVLRDGVEVPISAGQQRAVLATLALRAGRALDIAAITQKLWGDEPPIGAQTTVRGYIRRLRLALDGGGADSVIGTGAGGYRLKVASSDVDVHRFTGLLDRARAERGKPNELACLEQALSCWRGEVLEGVNCEALHRSVRPALEEQRLLAVQRRLDIRIEARDSLEIVIAELRGLVIEHPLRERFWGQLMVALHRAGRSAEALREFHTCREVLVDELGVDPGAELQELHRGILLGELEAPRMTRVQQPARVG